MNPPVPASPQLGRSDVLRGLLCALVVVACLLATLPFASTGMVDDWSTIKTAQVFAHTGHFVYNNWAAGMLGWQVPASALGIKLFGFSFTAAPRWLLPRCSPYVLPPRLPCTRKLSGRLIRCIPASALT